MMNKLWILLKNNFMNSYNLNAYSIKNLKNNKSKTTKKILLNLFVYIYIIAIVIGYAQMLYSSLAKENMQSIVVSVFVFFTVAIMIFKSIFSSKSTIFSSKDNDMLFAMPIKPSVIFANSVISLVNVNYILELVMLLPVLFVYGINMHLGILYYLISIVSMIFLPLIPVAISSIFGYLVAYISSKIKRKNIFEIVFQYIFLILIFVFSFSINSNANFANNAVLLNKVVGNSIYVLTLMQNAILNIDFISLFKFILINLGAFILFIYILKFNYKSILLRLKNNSNTGKYKEKILKVQNIDKALFNREMKSYFSAPIYVINTSFGLILIVISAICALFIGKENIFNMLEMPSNIYQYIIAVIMAYIGFFIGTVNTTCSSISLEGSRIWIIRTLPIKIKQIFKAKINTNLMIMLPLTIISTVIFSFAFDIKVFDFIKIVIFEILYGYIIANFGLITNLLFPKLDYKNQAQVVKQGMSAFVASFAPMIFMVTVIMIYLKIQSIITFNAYYYAMVLVLVILLFAEKKVINHWGVNKFKKLI